MSQSLEISLTATGVTKRFGKTTALRGISLQLKAGTMVGIIGPEGAGKTTFMRVVLGLLRPDEGEVSYFTKGHPIAFSEVRPSLAYMPSSQSLYSDLSIQEHLDFFRALYGVPQEQYNQLRGELLHITRLADFVDRPAGKLSGGMYKKLGLMCALLRSPQVLFLDEPTNGVDPISRREFWELLYRLSDQKILIVVTTAYMDEAERCGYVHLFENGLAIAEGTPRTLLEKENVKTFDALFLKRADEQAYAKHADRQTVNPSDGEGA